MPAIAFIFFDRISEISGCSILPYILQIHIKIPQVSD
jgi:hypothetical protein